MPWLSSKLLFSLLCMVCMHKGSSLNLDFMIFGNYVVIIFILTFIYICIYIYIYIYMDVLYVCMYVVVWQDHDCFMFIFICIYMYVCIMLFEKVIKNSSCGWMITYVGEWHEKIPSSWGIMWEE